MARCCYICGTLLLHLWHVAVTFVARCCYPEFHSVKNEIASVHYPQMLWIVQEITKNCFNTTSSLNKTKNVGEDVGHLLDTIIIEIINGLQRCRFGDFCPKRTVVRINIFGFRTILTVGLST